MTRKVTEPPDRLTRLCAAMIAALESHPERGAEKCIVFMAHPTEGDSFISGMKLHGYDDQRDAVTDLIAHLQAVLKHNGISMNVDIGEG